MSSISTTSAAASQAAAQAALQSAAQSIISGSTGSTMDVNSLVTAMVNSKVAGQSAALTAQAQVDTNKISALGTISAALSALQAGMTSLTDGSLLSSFTTTASGSGITTTAGTGAVAGTYSVAVSQIATSQSLTSGAFTANTALGTGTMTISVGSQQMNVDITSSNNTLSGIAAAINSASGNPGVNATVVTGTDGQHLVLNSTAGGASNVISTSISNLQGDAGLSSLGVTSTAGSGSGQSTFTSSGTIAWSQSTAGQDAEYTVGGVAGSSSSNTITAVNGVKMTLTSAAIGTTQTINVAQDTTAESTAINNFVSLYNTVVTTINSLTSFDGTQPQGSQAGLMLGDSAVNQVKNTLATIIGAGVQNGSSHLTLDSIGISLKVDANGTPDGELSVDSTALTTALSSNPSAVSTLFNSTNGIGAQINNQITSFLQTGGIIANEQAGLTTDQKSITAQQSTLADYTTQLTAQYNAQFTALNTLMSQMNQNSQYLTALFGGTDSAGALATNKS